MSGIQPLQGIGVTFQVNGFAAGSARVKPDGTIVLTGGGGTIQWALPVQTGLGANYGIRLTKSSSFPTGGIVFSPAAGTVWDLSVERLIQAVGGAGSVSGTLEITNLAGTIVYSTSSITVDNSI